MGWAADRASPLCVRVGPTPRRVGGAPGPRRSRAPRATQAASSRSRTSGRSAPLPAQKTAHFCPHHIRVLHGFTRPTAGPDRRPARPSARRLRRPPRAPGARKRGAASSQSQFSSKSHDGQAHRSAVEGGRFCTTHELVGLLRPGSSLCSGNVCTRRERCSGKKVYVEKQNVAASFLHTRLDTGLAASSQPAAPERAKLPERNATYDGALPLVSHHCSPTLSSPRFRPRPPDFFLAKRAGSKGRRSTQDASPVHSGPLFTAVPGSQQVAAHGGARRLGRRG